MSDKAAGKGQSGKFKEAARELNADEDEARWEERLRRVAKVAKDEPQGEPRKVAKAKPGRVD
jgi:hypothetical protein